MIITSASAAIALTKLTRNIQFKKFENKTDFPHHDGKYDPSFVCQVLAAYRQCSHVNHDDNRGSNCLSEAP